MVFSATSPMSDGDIGDCGGMGRHGQKAICSGGDIHRSDGFKHLWCDWALQKLVEIRRIQITGRRRALAASIVHKNAGSDGYTTIAVLNVDWSACRAEGNHQAGLLVSVVSFSVVKNMMQKLSF